MWSSITMSLALSVTAADAATTRSARPSSGPESSPGGFAEQILVPAQNARLDLLPVPPQVPVEPATLTEPLACCLRAQRRAGVGAETRLLVVGAGQMGLLHVQAARAWGCRAIVVAEPLEERRAAVARYGAVPASSPVRPRCMAVTQAS
jgi:L-iditol 2-dehydrogenase